MSEVRIKSIDKLGDVVPTLRAGDVIYFEPGFYYSREWQLQPVTTIFAHGATIKQDPEYRGCGSVISSDWELDTLAEIHGLTIDASRKELGGPMNCLSLSGSGNRVYGVKAINFGGDWESKVECYGILISGNRDNDPILSYRISDSMAIGGNGTYDNGIVAIPRKYEGTFPFGVMEGNLVRDMVPSNGDMENSHCVAYGTHGGRLVHNTVINVRTAVFSEASLGALIGSNDFHGCHRYGIQMRGPGEHHHATIERNLITMVGGTAIEMSGADGCVVEDTKVLRNTIVGTGKGIMLARKGTGQTVRDNTLDPRLTNRVSSDAVRSGNRTLTGKAIASLMDKPKTRG